MMKLSTISTRYAIWIGVLLTVLGMGLISIYIVLTQGLIVTGMRDIVTWGLFITSDMSFVALGAGAFITSGAYYVFHVKGLKPIVKSAVLLGFVCYLMSILALVVDTGRPMAALYLFISPQLNSYLEWVVWLVIFYVLVLVVENVPTVGESALGEKVSFIRKIGNWLHSIMPVFALAGIVISLLSAYMDGAIYSFVGARPMWYNATMSLLFITSAMAAGPSLVILSTVVMSKIMNREFVKTEVLLTVAKIVLAALTAYFFIRILYHYLLIQYSDIALRNEAIQFLTTGAGAISFWGGEMLLGVIIPIVILAVALAVPKYRESAGSLLLISSLLVIFGVMLNRWDLNFMGLVISPAGQSGAYTPTLVETMTVAGVVAIGALIYTVGVKYLKIFEHEG